MTKIIYDGYEFEIPEGKYTGHELQSTAKGDAVPVVRSNNGDVVIEPDKRARVGEEDRVVFTTPKEAA